MAKNPKWTPEEEEYLCEAWGKTSFSGISKHLGRSVNAVKIRVQRLGLPAFLESGEYVTMHQLVLALGYGGTSGSDGYKVKSWIQNRDFPVRTVKRGSSRVRVVYLDDFWEWAEQHRSFINFANMEPLALGAEPDWVAAQRRKDFEGCAIQRKDPWTADEDAKLKNLISKYQYGYAELSEMLHRSAGAIQRRCRDLNLKARPVRADNHGKDATWTDDHFRILSAGIKSGDGYMLISKAIGKSEKAVRGRVYNEYFTEDLDKVRKMIGTGEFFDNRPIPTVKQARYNSRFRTQIKHDLEDIAGILNAVAQHRRPEELKFDPYWQKQMCMNWDPIKACCTAGCENCDECDDFVRIRPQYCCRCGIDFLERTKNNFCPACRSARKKAAQRHWARTNRA